ncbi:MAG TPA: hypothetical protein VFW53_01470, partial [Gallionella sp.]|nr:hypothetical protein [Gallionella sp.]
MGFKYKTLCIAIAAMGFNNAYAEDADDKMFSFSGFGTIGAIQSSARNADFVADISAPTGVGSSTATSFNQLSRLGMQVNGTFTEQWSGVVQAVSERSFDKSFTPKLTQAHLKYQFSPSLDVRLGRMPISLFMLTEFTRIGYAMPYAMPPAETYGANMEVDGIDSTYKFNLGGVALSAHGYYGSLDYKIGVKGLQDPVTLKITDSKGIHLTADYGASTFIVGQISSQFTQKNPTIDGLYNLYRAAGF